MYKKLADEVSFYKENETRIIYINVTDGFNNFVAANISISVYTNATIPEICRDWAIYNGNLTYWYNDTNYALKTIDTGCWSLDLNPYYDMRTEGVPPGTYNITIVVTKENYTSASTTVIMHLKTIDQGQPIILDVLSPKNMTDVRPTHNGAPLTLTVKEDVRLIAIIITRGSF